MPAKSKTCADGIGAYGAPENLQRHTQQYAVGFTVGVVRMQRKSASSDVLTLIQEHYGDEETAWRRCFRAFAGVGLTPCPTKRG